MEKTFSTKLTKDGSAVETKCVIDWSNVSAEEMQKLAAATVIINQQAIYRTSGMIPATDTIVVRTQIDSPKGGGFKPTPENMAARIGKMDEAGYRASLVKIGVPEKVLEQMVKAKFHQA